MKSPIEMEKSSTRFFNEDFKLAYLICLIYSSEIFYLKI